MTIDGHIINLNLMTEGGWILDAGCRGFKLSKTLGSKFKYLCLDPDFSITKPEDQPDLIFRHRALMNYNGWTDYCGWSTGEGNYCYKEEAPHYATLKTRVRCSTIAKLSEVYQIKQFELAKLDIEGAEYDVLLSIDSPFAKQIAVEFHQCLGHNPYGTHQEYMNKLKSSQFGQIYKVTEFKEVQQGLYEYNFILK